MIMISPNTPPGTLVCCIDNSPGNYGPVGLTLGGYYTIDSIVKAQSGVAVATLVEVAPELVFDIPYGPMLLGFSLSRFRYLCIPDMFAELLVQKPEPVLCE